MSDYLKGVVLTLLNDMRCTKCHLINTNGEFNVNPWSNLILTIRLKEEVAMNKKGLGQGKNNILFTFQRRVFGEKKRGKEGLKRI